MEIHLYHPKFRSGVLSLLSRFWKSDPETTEIHFRLKYEENPYTERIFMTVLCDESGKTVGIRPLFFLPEKKIGPVLQLADAFISPEYRGQGWQQKMLGTLIDGLRKEFPSFQVLALSSNEQALRSYKKFGLRHLESLQLYGIGEWRGKVFKVPDRAGLLPPFSFTQKKEWERGNLRAADPEIFFRQHRIHLKAVEAPFSNLLTDPDYWAWRGAYPDFPLRTIYLHEAPESYLVVRVYPGRELRILAAAGTEDAQISLLRAMKALHAGRIRVLIPSRPSKDVALKNSGFIEVLNQRDAEREVLYLPEEGRKPLKLFPQEAFFDSFY